MWEIKIKITADYFRPTISVKRLSVRTPLQKVRGYVARVIRYMCEPVVKSQSILKLVARQGKNLLENFAPIADFRLKYS